MLRRITVSPIMFLLLPAAMLLLPLRWVMAWTLAVTVHELGHYIALRLCRVPLFAVTVTPVGVRMVTGELQGREALICALAGPVAGLSLTFLARYLPCSAFCGWLQGMFNLLPIYPLDGGRALRAILQKLCRRESMISATENGIAITFAAIAVILAIYTGIGVFPLGMFLFIFLQKFLANSTKNRYNREKKLF